MPYYHSYSSYEFEVELQIQSEEEFNRSFNEFLANKKQKQEDRKKYPLFFWRETCRKDSDQRETCKQKEKK